MKIIELEGKEYKVPIGWNEINIEKFEEIYRLSNSLVDYESETLFALDMFAVLTGAPRTDLEKLTRKGFETLAEITSWANGDIVPSNKKLFTIDGEEFIALDNMNSLTMGETISLEMMIKESKPEELLANILPILLRRVKETTDAKGRVKKVPSAFNAEEYASLKSLFRKNLYVTDVYNMKVFFSNIEKSSSTITKVTLEK